MVRFLDHPFNWFHDKLAAYSAPAVEAVDQFRSQKGLVVPPIIIANAMPTPNATAGTSEVAVVRNPTHMESNSNSRLFGLIIGINTYNRRSPTTSSSSGDRVSSANESTNSWLFPNLRGAVADAEGFRDYLTSYLGVPEKQMTLLCDAKATRAGIINAFKQLGDKENGIRNGDSIVIFYAGHGAQALPPKRLLGTSGCPQFVELLLPYDFNDGKQEDMGIPDYTLAALLNQIAETKGNNITVIFDCCHSASALRGFDTADSQAIVRAGPELNFNVPDELDEDIWGGVTRGLTVLPRLRHWGTASYVFFAACASFERARELHGRGCFTSALLTLLKKSSHTLPCSEIISSLEKIDGQSPQCEGRHIDRAIFHAFSLTFASRKRFFNVGKSSTGSQSGNSSERPTEFVLLDGGSLNGLWPGDELTVYKTRSDDDQNSPIGHLIIDDIFPQRATLKVRYGDMLFDLPSAAAPALLTAVAQRHLHLYIDPTDKYRADLVSLVKRLNLLGTVVIIDSESDRQRAHISLSSTEDRAHYRFDVVDVDCGHRLQEHLVNAGTDQETLTRIFKNLAHYYWHLKRGPSTTSKFSVDISFYKLEEPSTNHFRPIMAGEKDPVNLYDPTTRVIDLEVDEDSVYGMKITNKMQCDLFPALFYFDNADFTIALCYHPPLSNDKAEAPLKGKTDLTLGYGAGAGESVPPFSFFLSKNRKVEIGFFKLFLSTDPMNLRDMEQGEAVFKDEIDRGMKTLARQTTQIPTSDWASFTVRVVQRRKQSPTPPSLQ